VLWRKRQCTHLEIVSSYELFARGLPSSADTLYTVSASVAVAAVVQQLQVQLTALPVLQLQRADTPECVSASQAALQRALSENGNESKKTKGNVPRPSRQLHLACSGEVGQLP
jgi:hypothetical protein